jgi:hypothetical protein
MHYARPLKLGIMLVAALCCVSPELSGAPQSGRLAEDILPTSARAALDVRFPGWRLSAVNLRAREFVRERSAGANPNVIAGDFDESGQTDYAVLLDHPSAPPQVGGAMDRTGQVVALLEREGRYKLFVLKVPFRPDPRFCLTLQRKGESGNDLEANRRFAYPADSIGVWYYGAAGGTCIFSDGRFRFVVESD